MTFPLRVIRGEGTSKRRVVGRRRVPAQGYAIPSPFWDVLLEGLPYFLRFWVLDGGAAGVEQAARWARLDYGPASQPPIGRRAPGPGS